MRGEPPGFLEIGQVLSTYDGDLRDPLWWPQERPDPMRVALGLSGYLSRRCRCLRPCVESVPEPEDSSPVLTCNLGYFWSLFRGVSPRLGWGHAPFLPSCISSFTVPFEWIKGSVAFARGFPMRLSHEAFPRGFPTGLSHVPPWCESILSLKGEAVQGKQDSLEWTETSGELREWWHDPGVPLAFPVESASS